MNEDYDRAPVERRVIRGQYMILKNIEDENENITLHVRLDLPRQIDIDVDNAEMDLWIKTGRDVENDMDGGFVLNIKDILLEAAEDKDSTEAIISWIDYYKEKLAKKLETYNAK